MTVPRLTPTQYLAGAGLCAGVAARPLGELLQFADLIEQPSEQISDDAVIAACEQALRRLKSAAN
jgi:hypothetical protein